MAIPESKRWKHRGRASGPSYVAIPHFVLESPQWAALEPLALKLLLELARQYKGNNNGDLAATLTMLKDRGWNSKDTLTSRLKALLRDGWIIQTRQGGRHAGCSLFAVTWWNVDECAGKHSEPATRKPPHLWKNANGGPPHGPRCPAPRTAKPVAVRRTDRKVVRMRPAA